MHSAKVVMLAFFATVLLLLPGCGKSPSATDKTKEVAQRPVATEPTTAEPAAPPAAPSPPVAKPEETVAVEPMPTSDRIAEALKTKAVFLEKDPGLQQFFDRSHGYAIFPTVTKGGLIVHGASGKGVVFEQGRPIGYSTLSQGGIGATVGGQAYSELIFFQTEPVLADFRSGNAKFSAQVSAVATTSGASANAAYQNGVVIFTMAKGGLMLEASIGGQGFEFEPLPGE